jgi:hypothetical protein
MRAILVPAALAIGVAVIMSSSTSAPAAGCLKDAVLGGVVGPYVGHHGALSR